MNDSDILAAFALGWVVLGFFVCAVINVPGWVYSITGGITFTVLAIAGATVAVDRHRDSVERKRQLEARAWAQHQKYLSGNDEGIYGEYPPADLN